MNAAAVGHLIIPSKEPIIDYDTTPITPRGTSDIKPSLMAVGSFKQ